MMANHIKQDNANELCYPYLRTSFKTNQACAEYGDHCLQKSLPCNSCCEPVYEHQPINGFAGKGLHYDQPPVSHFENTEGFKQHQPSSSHFGNTGGLKQHLHHVAHDCPLGKIILCEQDNGKKYDQDIIKAKEISSQRHKDPDGVADEFREAEKEVQRRERPCCARKSSCTEPRICRCDISDPLETSKNCECECGAAVTKPKKEKKRVRFDDEKTMYIDCDKAFRNLDVNDIKELCSCCKECAVKCQDQCVCKPVLVYELPEAKFEDKSITQNDFGWQKAPQKEMPPWHPNIKDRWKQLDVPSLAETTYQCDFKPPPVLHAEERKPVYLAPQREEYDPCQQLAEEYSAFKKTSTGPSHVYHSSCENCDKDLHRVHLHECDVSHLPPQYQCHGDGHICEPQHECHLGDKMHDLQHECCGEDHSGEPEYPNEEKFNLCEVRNPGKSRYWWKRSCFNPEREVGTAMNDLPPNLKNAACPDYITMYKHDFKNPMKIHNGRTDVENCSACDYCTSQPRKEEPTFLCTKDARRPFMTQRAGII